MQLARKSVWQGLKAGTWGARALPVLAALLLAALDRQQVTGSSDWPGFLRRLGMAGIAGLPLLAAHLFVDRLSRSIALGLWSLAFIAYPLAALSLAEGQFPLEARHWIIAALFSAVSLLSSAGGKSQILSVLRRVPVTLDGAASAVLAVWTLAVTSLFASTPDAVNNQPLRIWFDAGRLSSHPIEFVSYFVQFSVVAALLFGFFWVCRHILIRRVLRSEGWIALALASLALWIVYTPLACSLVLLLPINPPNWSLLPSENHNPFDPINYGFAFILWATITPILLASERLLVERSDAMGRHEQVRAELHMLQQQINPHFLFNSLNTLYALCLKDSGTSAEAVVKLSDLLRYAVYEGQKAWTRLDEEIAYLNNYLDLQLLRFGSRCRVSCSWPDRADKIRVPPLLLIMLVENAFKHGIEPMDETTNVRIDLAVENGKMRFICVNSPAPPSPLCSTSGLGLGNMRRRLELLFDDGFTLSSIRVGNAWRAELEIAVCRC